MTEWSSYLFGTFVFLGAGMMMLTGQVSEWWTVVSIVITLVAASAFLIRSIVEYRRSRDAGEGSEHRSLV